MDLHGSPENLTALDSHSVATQIISDLDRTHGRQLFAAIRKQSRQTMDVHASMDVYQETLLQTWLLIRRKLEAGNYEAEHPVRLAIGVMSRVIRAARRRARQQTTQVLPAFLSVVGETTCNEGDSQRNEILSAIALLTPVQRRVVNAHLTYVDETGRLRKGRYLAMSRALELPKDTIRRIFRKSIMKMRSYLNQ